MPEVVIGFNGQYERRTNLEIDGKSPGSRANLVRGEVRIQKRSRALFTG